MFNYSPFNCGCCSCPVGAIMAIDSLQGQRNLDRVLQETTETPPYPYVIPFRPFPYIPHPVLPAMTYPFMPMLY